MGITQRKSLNEQRRQFQAQYNRWSLARNPQLTKFAGEISDAMQWDPDRDVRAAIHRVQAADMDQHTIDVTAAVKKVLRPEIHGKGVDQLFGRALAESPTDEETDILRQTHKILRRARWVHEHPKPQKRPAGQRNDGTGQLQL